MIDTDFGPAHFTCTTDLISSFGSVQLSNNFMDFLTLVIIVFTRRDDLGTFLPNIVIIIFFYHGESNNV